MVFLYAYYEVLMYRLFLQKKETRMALNKA